MFCKVYILTSSKPAYTQILKILDIFHSNTTLSKYCKIKKKTMMADEWFKNLSTKLSEVGDTI